MYRGARRALATITISSALAATAAFAQDAILTGTDGNDTINGTAAGESIYARGGNDIVTAGAGDDELDGGAGADALNGGDGSDSVAYSGSESIEVSLDGIANDGAAAEGDNVGADVEDIFGADGKDKLTGSASANTIDGGAGDDQITGGDGTDALFGGDGDDVINARDHQIDRVECGPGTDTATIDRGDVVALDCETRAKPPATGEFLFSLFRASRASRGRRVAQISGVTARSRVVIVCASGCSPRTLVQSPAVTTKVTKVRLPLPSSARLRRGAILEVGVTAPRADTRCVSYKLSRTLGPERLKTRKCTTAAAS